MLSMTWKYRAKPITLISLAVFELSKSGFNPITSNSMSVNSAESFTIINLP